MAKVIKVQISIGKQRLNKFFNLTLDQVAFDHHKVQIVAPFDSLNDGNDLVLNSAKDLVGEPISVLLSKKDSNVGAEFDGVVCRVNHQKSSTQINTVVIVAYGKTLHLDGLQLTRSFTDMTVKNIISEALKPFQSQVEFVDNTGSDGNIKLPFRVQYDETTFNFISRLAKEIGHSLYYDGKKLMIGKPKSSRNVKLVFPNELTDLRFDSGISDIFNHKQQYDYKAEEYFDHKISKSDLEGSHALAKSHLDKSVSFFGSESTSFYSSSITDEKQLKGLLTNQSNAEVGTISKLTGELDNPEVSIGTTVHIQIKAKVNSNQRDGDYGKFTIMNIRHQVDGIGNYTASFEAISSTSRAFPCTVNLSQPQAFTQIAKVVENKDPDKIGRVTVHFPWMAEGQKTPWLRVLTSYAGTDRGIYFQPEVDDEVIVGFDGGNLDSPFVLGSVYTGKRSPQDFDDENNVKSIRTRSGNLITLDDKDGNEQIQIATAPVDGKQQNTITISLKDHSIELASAESITIKSKEIELNGENIQLKATKDISIKANGNIAIEAQKNIERKSGMDINDSAGKNLSQKASANASIKASANVKVEAGAQLATKGMISKSEASAINEIKGGLVKIN